MTAEVKSKWTAALRSGHYKQVKDILYKKEHGSFCCIGIKMDLDGLSKDMVGGKCFVGFDNWIDYMDTVHGVSLTDSYTLAQINDSGKTFSEIATWIDTNL